MLYSVSFAEDATRILFNKEVTCVSWASHNGGVRHNIVAVVNRTLTDFINDDAMAGFIEKNTILPDQTVVLLTTVPQRYIQTEVRKDRKTGLEIAVFCTAGIGNALAVGDRASYNEGCKAGTINLIIIANRALTVEAQIELSSIVTMAKCRVLYDKQIISPVSGDICSGTGTDCVVICSPHSTGKPLKYAGLHTRIAEITGNAVISVLARSLDIRLASR